MQPLLPSAMRHEAATGILHWCDRYEGPFIPARQQMLAEALARRVPVLTTRFVSSSRRPTVERALDDRNGLTTVAVDFGAAARLRPVRLRRHMTPLIARQLRAFARSIGVERFVLYRVGHGPYSTLGLSPIATIVDLIDPPFVENSLEQYRRSLPQMLKGADLVTATARTLADEARAAGYEVINVPNACQDVATVAPRRLSSRVGYLGTLDWRFDTRLVEQVATSMPDVEFFFAGRQLDSMAREFSRLADLPNVVMPGVIDFDETSRLLATFDVGVIPFRRGFVGDSINPVKMYEYLAHGIPVVSTPIRECLELPELVTCPTSPEGWVSTLREALRSRDAEPMRRRRAWAAANTWDVRAEQMVRALVDKGSLAASAARQPIGATRIARSG
ncbi:MAG: glycosyltransferase [Actinomycetia bacterium]|nr:glycosyltransferase [Actinomycetes bacterium]